MRSPLAVVIPAAGIGSRMAAEIPKQYLPLLDKTVIEFSLAPFLAHPAVSQIIVALSPYDSWFSQLPVARHPKICITTGGAERADSVLAGLSQVQDAAWVLVHDAARPCITLTDINKLIDSGSQAEHGAILGSVVRDTMKRTNEMGQIVSTVERVNLWHALTPQMFPLPALKRALKSGLEQGKAITDEASAMQLAGYSPLMVEGRVDNIKVTRPEDMPLAALYLSRFEQQDKKND